MGGVQFAFLTLPLHLQRELCIVMLGTGCKFFRIFIVGADARGYMYLLCPHILQPVCLVSYPPTRLPTYRYTTLFPSIHLTTYPSTYLPTHTHTHTHKHTLYPTSQGSGILLSRISIVFPVSFLFRLLPQENSYPSIKLAIHHSPVFRLRIRRICALFPRVWCLDTGTNLHPS